MPEMMNYFGKSFTVAAQVERACDTIGRTGARRLPETVVLDDLRCDGSAHAGCQSQCRLYWKEAWLRPASSNGSPGRPVDGDGLAHLRELASASVPASESTLDQPVFRCQATEMVRASEPVGWWSLRSFTHELTGGNVRVWQFVPIMLRIVLEEIGRRVGFLSSNPFRPKQLANGSGVRGPRGGLEPGQLVRIRTKQEICGTLNKQGKNRGLWFDREMMPYCGHTARVTTKVERFIDERTGRLVQLASDCYILDEVVCRSYHSEGRWFCPRAIYPWWREAWLDPVDTARQGEVEGQTD